MESKSTESEVEGGSMRRIIGELKKSAQCVQDALTAKNMKFEVVQLSDCTRTADDAAKAIGCSTAQIMKSLVFQTKQSKQPILVLASGTNQVNVKALKSEVGENLSKPDAKYVKETTGFSIGGIPPIGHLQKLPTYIDADLLKQKTLWAAAGTPNAVFSLESCELEQLTEGKVMSIK